MPHLEHQLFSHLFPLAQGGFIQGHKGMTLGKYNHLPLLHVDRRGAHDKMYPFFLFDRSMKVQIHAYSQQCLWASNRRRQGPITQGDIVQEGKKDAYYQYGNYITSCLQLCQAVLGTGRNSKNGLVWLLQFRDATLFCHPHSK